MNAKDVENTLKLTNDSKTLILSGTHGDEYGQSAVDAMAQGNAAGGYVEKAFFVEDTGTVAKMKLQGNVTVIDMPTHFAGVRNQSQAVDQLAAIIKEGQYENIISGFCYGQRSDLVQSALEKYSVHMWVQKKEFLLGALAASETDK